MGFGISLLAGPTCRTAFTVNYMPKTLSMCEVFIAVTVLDVAHSLGSLTWMVWLLQLVPSNDFAGRIPWRMSVARMLRREEGVRVTLNEQGQIVDSGGMWQLVDPSNPDTTNGQWPEVHPATPLLSGSADGSGGDDAWDVQDRRLAPPPYHELGHTERSKSGKRAEV